MLIPFYAWITSSVPCITIAIFLLFNLPITCNILGTKKKVCSGYDTKLNLMVRLRFSRSGDSRELLHCDYSQVHSGGNTCQDPIITLVHT